MLRVCFVRSTEDRQLRYLSGDLKPDERVRL